MIDPIIKVELFNWSRENKNTPKACTACFVNEFDQFSIRFIKARNIKLLFPEKMQEIVNRFKKTIF